MNLWLGLGVVDVAQEWPAIAIGGGVAGLIAVLFTVTFRAFGWSIGAYKGAGEFEAQRVDLLEEQVQKLTAKVHELEAEYRHQRQLKHDWRAFASSLMQERWTIFQFAELHGCGEIVELMNRLDEMRRDHPLMTDVQTIVRGDPI